MDRERTSGTIETDGLLGLAGTPADAMPVAAKSARPMCTRPDPPEGVARRIIFVNRFFHPDLSATSQILSDLTQRLADDGFEVHVVCSRQLYDNPSAILPPFEVVHGVQVHRAWTARFGRDRLLGRALDYVSFYVTGMVKLTTLLSTGDIVVAKTDPPLISIAAAGISRIRGARLINWLQDVFPEVASQLGSNPLPKWLDASLKKLRDRSLTAAMANVVLGTRMREHLQRRGITDDGIHIIENWADGEAVVTMPVSSSDLRKSIGITNNEFVVAYSGNLGRAHEFETILAAAEILKDDEQIIFLMIGGGVNMQNLRSESVKRQLSNLRFLPYQARSALSDSLAAADVHLACLLPSLEGLIVPSKFYGILAAGRPTIFIGDLDGELPRIMRDAHCGVAVSCGDGMQLVREVRKLQSEPELRHEMGQNARSLFVQKYTVERAVSQWTRLLRCAETCADTGVAKSDGRQSV